MSPFPFVIQYEPNNSFPFQFCIRVGWQGKTYFTAYVEAGEDVKDALFDAEKQVDKVRDSVARWAIHEVEAQLQDAADVRIPEFVKLKLSDPAPVLEFVAAQKECVYQIREARDLFCVATNAKFDSTAVVSPGGKTQAPTSKALCRACDLPDTDILCSLLTHPIVGVADVTSSPNVPQGATATTPPSTIRKRMLYGAMCDEGRKELVRGVNCRPGGNACWRRIVEPEQPSAVPHYTAPGLTQSLDYLDAIWRLKFGARNNLIRIRSASATAALETNCSSREEFRSRLSDLADVLKLLNVPDALLSGEEIPPDQTFRRLASCLKSILDSEEMERVDRALKTLGAVNEARVALQHSATRANLARAFNTLGIPLPQPGWGECWDIVRAQAARALTVLSSELNRHT